jgi:glyoxylase-like metal-dependent hydrolase (beta-lactamase superfamily II)
MLKKRVLVPTPQISNRIIENLRVLRFLFLLLLTLALPARAQPCEPHLRAQMVPVMKDVWFLPGVVEEVNPSNGGRVTGSVVFVSTNDVTILDPGPSLRHAQRLRRAVACLTRAPIRRILNSHAHAENVLGNHGFASATVAATRTTRENMRTRCPQCLHSMFERAGKSAIAGTQIRLPSETLRDGETLTLGGQAWRVIEIVNAHTESDMALWNEESRVLIATPLIYNVARVPELAQGSTLGWIDALDRLAALSPKTVVGYALHTGAPSEAFASTRSYLCALVRHAWAGLEKGELDSEITPLHLPQYQAAQGYATRHMLNVRRTWREMESHWLRSQRPAQCDR